MRVSKYAKPIFPILGSQDSELLTSDTGSACLGSKGTYLLEGIKSQVVGLEKQLTKCTGEPGRRAEIPCNAMLQNGPVKTLSLHTSPDHGSTHTTRV